MQPATKSLYNRRHCQAPPPRQRTDPSLAAGRRPGTPRKLLALAAQNRGNCKSARAQGARDLAWVVRGAARALGSESWHHEGVCVQG